jgi:hypothetical protein
MSIRTKAYWAEPVRGNNIFSPGRKAGCGWHVITYHLNDAALAKMLTELNVQTQRFKSHFNTQVKKLRNMDATKPHLAVRIQGLESPKLANYFWVNWDKIN